MPTTMTKKELNAMLVAERRAAKEKHRASALKAKTRNIFKGQQKRAEEMGRLGEINFTLEDFRREVGDISIKECCYCKTDLTVKNFTVDHMVPVSRPLGTFAMPNLALCCMPCNYQKGSLDYSEFNSLLYLLSCLPPESATDIKRRLTIGGKFSPGRK
jgi:5-methylcytosine-specific restriction endonuclease McrA